MLLPININNHQSHAIYHQISLSLARAGRISTYVKGATLSKRSRAFVELDDADRIGVVLDEAADRQTERLVLRAPSNVVIEHTTCERDIYLWRALDRSICLSRQQRTGRRLQFIA